MKSKTEIIDAINRCGQFENHCDGCPYGDFGDRICIDLMFDDIISIINKNDFEVVKEVLDKSLILDWERYSEDDDYYRTKRLSAKDARGTVYELAFDAEGNIL